MMIIIHNKYLQIALNSYNMLGAVLPDLHGIISLNFYKTFEVETAISFHKWENMAFKAPGYTRV